MNIPNIVFLLAALFFLVAFVIMIFLYIREKVVRIDPSQCPHIAAQYAVRPSQYVTPLQNSSCPGESQCQFSVKSLSDAISQCNSQPDLCEAFIFSFEEQGAIMWYVDPNGTPQTQTNVDLYIRQS